MDIKSVFDLLHEDEPTTEESKYCYSCGESCPPNIKICPHCNEYSYLPTMAEWGKQLPIGIEEGSNLNKDFDIVPLSWKLEREIGRFWESRRSNLTISDYIGGILAHTVTRLGSSDFKKHRIDKRVLIFNQMFAGDVFYIYGYLRLISIGKDLRLDKVKCPHCNSEFEFTADLSSIEVVPRINLESLRKTLELRDGFEMAGELRKTLVIKPMIWNLMSVQLESGFNQAEVFSDAFINSIDEIDGVPKGVMITEKQVSQLTKYDMSLIEEQIDKTTGGPRWEVEGKCTKCNGDFFSTIDWSYGNFFALSSRSVRPRRPLRR
jgi:hypothetical protein